MNNKEIVKRFFLKGYNDNDYNEVIKLLSKDYYDHSPAAARSDEEAIGILKIVESNFPDMKVEIIDLIEEDNKVVGRFKFTATHSTEYMGVKPTNKKIQWEAIEIFRIENKKIVESWGYWPDDEIRSKLQNINDNL